VVVAVLGYHAFVRPSDRAPCNHDAASLCEPGHGDGEEEASNGASQPPWVSFLGGTPPRTAPDACKQIIARAPVGVALLQ